MKVRWVAELGSSHGGSLLRAIKLIDATAKAGFGAVKTQAWDLGSLFRPEALEAMPALEKRRRYELPLDWHETLYELARDQDLRYGTTVSDKQTIPHIAPWVDFWKVSSYDLLRLDLLRALGATGKPTTVSTGMATMPEVMAAREAFLEAGNASNLTLLHCVSSYPALPRDANLRAIDTMQKFCGQPIGWSDHTVSAKVVERSVWRWRATTVELHLDLDDMRGAETTGHVWTATQAAQVIKRLQYVPIPELIDRDDESDGHGRKEPMPCETEERNWRADPEDGLRPLKEHIKCLAKTTATSS